MVRGYLPQIDEVVSCPAVAGDGEVAGLSVQGEQGEVHGAAQGQGDLNVEGDREILNEERQRDGRDSMI